MTTSTFYAGTNDGALQSSDSVFDAFGDYSLARAGTGNPGVTVIGNLFVGQETYSPDVEQNGSATVYEAFIDFLTSDIPDGDTIDSATLSLWLVIDNSIWSDFTINARIYSFGTLTTADWRTTYTQTLVATKSTVGIGATGAYKDFTSESAFVSNINKTGETEIVLFSSRTESGTSPGFGASNTFRYEYVSFQDSSYVGVDRDPKLVVVHSAGGATYTKMHSVDSRRKKETLTRNQISGTSGNKVTIDNSEAGGDKFSDVKP